MILIFRKLKKFQVFKIFKNSEGKTFEVLKLEFTLNIYISKSNFSYHI